MKCAGSKLKKKTARWENELISKTIKESRTEENNHVETLVVKLFKFFHFVLKKKTETSLNQRGYSHHWNSEPITSLSEPCAQMVDHVMELVVAFEWWGTQ